MRIRRRVARVGILDFGGGCRLRREGMEMKYAEKMNRLGQETAFMVLARAKELEAAGRSIVHLEIGEPDFDTPSNISEAAIKALREGYTHYGPSAGLPEVRECIAEYISRDRNIKVGPKNVVVTPGAKPIMFFSILACVEEGDEVLYPNPGFPIYESMINFVGAKPVPLPLKENKGFRFDVGDLENLLSPRTKMLIINSPQNPTGGMLTQDDLAAIAELVKDRDILILSDEIYSKIIYEGKHSTIASFPELLDRIILLDGFSKTYAMTGWRLGYGVMRQELAAHVEKLMNNANSCTCSFIQRAAIEALTGPQDAARKMVEAFRERRDVIVDGLNHIEGFSCLKPKGAFYVFPNIKGTGMSSKELEKFCMETAGVAVLSGTAFGANGEGYVRFSYANSVPNIKEALSRIQKALAARKK
jgi:aspartate aminotransferase